MMSQYHDQIAIAGMGETGQSVARYLDASGVDYLCCDDGEGSHPDCTGLMKGYDGYVIKSPGIAPSDLAANHAATVINDVELLLRLTRKPVVMVTGTNGKSTVVTLIEHILQHNDVSAIACGNNGVPVLDAFASNADLYVLELSSYQLENLATFTSFASVVLNIGVDHVDRYRDMQEYQQVKQRVYIAADVCVYPVDGNGEVTYAGEISGYLARSKAGDVVFSVQGDELYRNGAGFCDLRRLNVSGRHNYLNICAALALIDQLMLDHQRVVSALKSFVGLPHRMELVCVDDQGRKWINDSKSTNVHSMLAALSGRSSSVCLIVGGRGKREDYSVALSNSAAVIGKLIIFGEDAAIIDSQATMIADRTVVGTVAEAVALADSWSGDILFSPACASFDQYSSYIERGEDFRRQVLGRAVCQARN